MTDPIRTPADALEAAAKLQRANAGRDPRTVEAMILGLSARIAAPDDEALVEIVAQALWERGAMSFAPWCEADEIARQSYADEARAVLTALREVGALL